MLKDSKILKRSHDSPWHCCLENSLGARIPFLAKRIEIHILYIHIYKANYANLYIHFGIPGLPGFFWKLKTYLVDFRSNHGSSTKHGWLKRKWLSDLKLHQTAELRLYIHLVFILCIEIESSTSNYCSCISNMHVKNIGMPSWKSNVPHARRLWSPPRMKSCSRL